LHFKIVLPSVLLVFLLPSEIIYRLCFSAKGKRFAIVLLWRYYDTQGPAPVVA